MAKLESLNWPQDPIASAMLTALLIDAAEVLASFIPDDRMKEAADRIDENVSRAAEKNAGNAAALTGIETARTALAQIVRR